MPFRRALPAHLASCAAVVTSFTRLLPALGSAARRVPISPAARVPLHIAALVANRGSRATHPLSSLPLAPVEALVPRSLPRRVQALRLSLPAPVRWLQLIRSTTPRTHSLPQLRLKSHSHLPTRSMRSQTGLSSSPLWSGATTTLQLLHDRLTRRLPHPTSHLALVPFFPALNLMPSLA